MHAIEMAGHAIYWVVGGKLLSSFYVPIFGFISFGGTLTYILGSLWLK